MDESYQEAKLKKRLFGLLVLIGLLFAAQQAFYFMHRILEAKNQAESSSRLVVELLNKTQDQLKVAQIRNGDLWAGELPQQDDVVENAAQSQPQPVHDLTSQRRIHRTLQLDEGSMQSEIELHECNPGNKSCKSGGTLELRSAQGSLIMTGTVTLFQERGKSAYEFRWANSELSENEKILMITRIVGDRGPNEKLDLFHAVSKLYGFEAMTEADGEECLTHDLIIDILRKSLNDRNRI